MAKLVISIYAIENKSVVISNDKQVNALNKLKNKYPEIINNLFEHNYKKHTLSFKIEYSDFTTNGEEIDDIVCRFLAPDEGIICGWNIARNPYPPEVYVLLETIFSANKYPVTIYLKLWESTGGSSGETFSELKNGTLEYGDLTEIEEDEFMEEGDDDENIEESLEETYILPNDLYEKGVFLSTQEDYEEAFKWYLKAAKKGSILALVSLGDCYYRGEGIEQDYNKAVEWYQKAADYDDNQALFCMGECFFFGHGVEQNIKEAISYYIKADSLGWDVASYKLGIIFHKGYGVKQDLQKAFQLFVKSAKAGYSGAMYELGKCYEEGLGTEINFKKAKKWYIQAIDNYDDKAEEALQNLEKKIEAH